MTSESNYLWSHVNNKFHKFIYKFKMQTVKIANIEEEC